MARSTRDQVSESSDDPGVAQRHDDAPASMDRPDLLPLDDGVDPTSEHPGDEVQETDLLGATPQEHLDSQVDLPQVTDVGAAAGFGLPSDHSAPTGAAGLTDPFGFGVDHHGIGDDTGIGGRTNGAAGVDDYVLDPADTGRDPVDKHGQYSDGESDSTRTGPPLKQINEGSGDTTAKDDRNFVEKGWDSFKSAFDLTGGTDGGTAKPQVSDPPGFGGAGDPGYDEAPPEATGDTTIGVFQGRPDDGVTDPNPHDDSATGGPIPQAVHVPVGGGDPVNPQVVDDNGDPEWAGPGNDGVFDPLEDSTSGSAPSPGGQVDGGGTAGGSQHDSFSPGQFSALSDDAKLASPDFEAKPSGMDGALGMDDSTSVLPDDAPNPPTVAASVAPTGVGVAASGGVDPGSGLAGAPAEQSAAMTDAVEVSGLHSPVDLGSMSEGVDLAGAHEVATDGFAGPEPGLHSGSADEEGSALLDADGLPD